MDEPTTPAKHSQSTVREPVMPGRHELTPDQAKELLQAIEDVEREEADQLGVEDAPGHGAT